MCCRGMQYEVGKTYHVAGKLELCQNGLHFCRNLVDVFDFYPNRCGNRFFEVESDDPICGDGKKYATATLTVLRELPVVDVNRAVYGYGNGDGNGYGNGDGDGNGNGDGYGYKNIQKVLIFSEKEKIQ